MDLIDDFKKYITQEFSIHKQKILLGVSGGPDSLCMLDLFDRIKDEFKLDLVVFHLNHQMREDAETDAEFVVSFCNDRGIKVNREKYNVLEFQKNKGLSPEEAARKVRFKLMKNKANSLGIKHIALAHNRDDHVETILLNIFRGSGLVGLTGISPVSFRGDLKIIHPLLYFDREEIEKYCDYRKLNPRLDPTNKQSIYTRNKIRHQVIPYIEKEINPAVKDKINQLAQIVKQENSHLEREAEQVIENIIKKEKKNQITIDLLKLKNLDQVIRRRVLKSLIFRIKEEPVDIYYYHYQALEDLIFKSETGKRLDLTGKVKIKKSYNKLIIKKGEFSISTPEFNILMDVPDFIRLPFGKSLKTEFLVKENVDSNNLRNNDNICFCDTGKVNLPFFVRNRKNGDMFQPLGMKGKKKVKDFFIDEKILPKKRDQIPVIVDSDNQIVWLAGLRMDERIKIDDQTTGVIKITYSDFNE